jgi:putative DNA primase/helicase
VTRLPDFRRVDVARAALNKEVERRQQASQDDGVVLIQGTSIRPAPVSWLWQHWLALGKLHILAGQPGQGKTTIALACAAVVSSGGCWPDGSRCASGNVLIWSGEDDPADTLVPRLLAMGSDLSRVHFVDGTRIEGRREPFDPARDLVALTKKAASIGDVHLLIVDPVVSAVAGDSHRNTEVRRDLQPVVDLGVALNCAVLGISHFSKGSSGREPVERVTGSVAFGAVARVVMCAAKIKGDDGEDRRILARAKSNIGPDEGAFEYGIEQLELPAHPGVSASRVAWGKAMDGTARELLAEAEADPTDNEEGPGSAAQWLQQLLEPGPVSAQDVKRQADEAGYSWRSVQRAMRRAGVDSRRTGFGRPAEWFLLPSCATVAPVAPHQKTGANGATVDNEAEVL